MINKICFCLALLVLSACVNIDKSAHVVQLGDNYDIYLYSKNVWLTPISSEGAFPIDKQFTRLTTIGKPDTELIKGVQFNKYVIGDNIRVQHNKYTAGTLLISEQKHELIFHGKIAPSYYDHDNHSGSYTNIKIDKPKIMRLYPNVNLSNYINSYVIATGKFDNRNGIFISEGHKLYTGGSWLNETANYEVIGEIRLFQKQPIPVYEIIISTYNNLSGIPDDGCFDEPKSNNSP